MIVIILTRIRIRDRSIALQQPKAPAYVHSSQAISLFQAVNGEQWRTFAGVLQQAFSHIFCMEILIMLGQNHACFIA